MLKKLNCTLLLMLILIILSGCTFSSNNNSINNSHLNDGNTVENNNEYTASKISKITDIETDLSTFSTPILDKTENRQNNIRITCTKLNNIIVDPGCTFSFCNTIGKSTESEGYKKATILVNGKEEQALGGRKLPSKHNTL